MKTTVLYGLLVIVALLPLREAVGQQGVNDCPMIPRLSAPCEAAGFMGYIEKQTPFASFYKNPVIVVGKKMTVANIYDLGIGDTTSVHFLICQNNQFQKVTIVAVVEANDFGYLRLGFRDGIPSWIESAEIDTSPIDSTESLHIVAFVNDEKQHVEIHQCAPAHGLYKYLCMVKAGFAAYRGFAGVVIREGKLLANTYGVGYNQCREAGVWIESLEGGYFYEAVESALAVGVDDLPISSFSLSSPWPNPTASFAELELSVERSSQIVLQIYDIQGKLVRVIHQGVLPSGIHRFTYDTEGLPNGVYFVRAISEMNSSVQKLIVAR